MALCLSRRRRTLLRTVIVIFPAAFLLAFLASMKVEDAEHRENFSHYSQQMDHGQQRVDFQERKDFQNANFDSKKRRRNILIIAHGRSGSTITGDIFNHHPSVFYLHEPLQTVQRIFSKNVGNSHEHYGSLMADILSNLLRCNFSKSVLEDFDHFYRNPNHRRASNAICSPPLCPHEVTDPRWDPKLCPAMTSESLGSTCRDKYSITVAKILMSRIEGNHIKNILEACKSSDTDWQIIYLIRDPRAVIPSSQSVGFFSNRGSLLSKNGLRLFSYQRCSQTEENLIFLKNIPISWRRRILIQRYEDFTINPLKVLSGLFNFAGLPVLDSVKTWLNKSTHPAQNREKMKMEGHPALYTVDDASVAVNRWRWKVHPWENDIIEHYCKHVMQLMGYIPVDRSYQLMSDISIPLFSEHYEAKKWFQN